MLRNQNDNIVSDTAYKSDMSVDERVMMAIVGDCRALQEKLLCHI